MIERIDLVCAATTTNVWNLLLKNMQIWWAGKGGKSEHTTDDSSFYVSPSWCHGVAQFLSRSV